jgi:hypothetical protein
VMNSTPTIKVRLKTDATVPVRLKPDTTTFMSIPP